MLAFHEKFVLLTINDEKGNIAPGYVKTLGFAGALLLELAEKNLITTEGKTIVCSAQTADSAILNSAIEILKSAKKPMKTATALQKIANKLYKQFDKVIEGLIEKEILRLEEKKVLWLFKVKHYPTKNSEPENLIKSRIKGIVLYGNQTDNESLNLIGLIHALNLHKEIFTKEEMKQAKTKIKELISNETVAKEISRIIQQQITAAVIASTVAASAASSTN